MHAKREKIVINTRFVRAKLSTTIESVDAKYHQENAKMRSILFAAVGIVLSMGAAQAQEVTDCAVTYNRTACTGQEETSYKKCDGDPTCVKYKKADSLEACQAAALKACGNRRLNITKSKVVTATFQGQPIKSTSGNEDFCLDYPKRDQEYNQCTVN